MPISIEDVFSYYAESYRTYEKTHPALIEYLSQGIWAPPVLSDLIPLFERCAQPQGSFLDLGSGDGCVVLLASFHFSKAVGVERERAYHVKALEALKQFPSHHVRFLLGDYLVHDVSPYTVVFISPDKPFSLALEQKLKRELKGMLIVYGVWQPTSLKKIWGIQPSNVPITAYENTQQ